MCYSAMLESRYATYVRETGAEMDVEQFEEIFGWRETGGLRILRAVERWFDNPRSPGEQSSDWNRKSSSSASGSSMPNASWR
jgi:hypothetical protein